MKLRRADNVGLIAGVRRVAERAAEERDQREEARVWEQPAATVEIERRCAVCRAVCEDDAGQMCPVNDAHPQEHAAAAQLIARIRAERSRPLVALLTGQLQTVLGRLQAG
jgi:hypothetical protein